MSNEQLENQIFDTSNNYVEEDDDISADGTCYYDLSNFTFGRTIGNGAFGKVKIAVHNFTKEKVAIKILDKNKMNSETDIDHVRKEISILRRIKHRNICQLYEIRETEDHLFLIMELAEKGDLFGLISQKVKLTEHEACRYFQQIINSLDYLHSLNIAHRDIKPENMLINSDNELKLSDFGLSNFYESDNLLSTPCGTPVYASPELMKGEDYHGMFNDIWSAGVVLYAMLTGCLPFDDSDDDLLHNKIKTGVFTCPDFISPSSKDLIKRILHPDPTQRYDFEQIKAHPWFNCVKYTNYPGIITNFHIMPIDDKILGLLEGYFEVDKEKIRDNLIHYEFNENTTTYFLLLKKFEKEGGISVADMKSQDYLDHMNNRENTFNHSNSKEAKSQNKNNEKEKIQFTFDKKKARASLYEYRLKNDIEDPELIDSPHVPLAGKKISIIRRTTNEVHQVFLDLLEKKALKEADNEPEDCEKLLEFFIEKKNYLEAHKRFSIKINYNDLNDIGNKENKPIRKETEEGQKITLQDFLSPEPNLERKNVTEEKSKIQPKSKEIKKTLFVPKLKFKAVGVQADAPVKNITKKIEVNCTSNIVKVEKKNSAVIKKEIEMRAKKIENLVNKNKINKIQIKPKVENDLQKKNTKTKQNNESERRNNKFKESQEISHIKYSSIPINERKNKNHSLNKQNQMKSNSKNEKLGNFQNSKSKTNKLNLSFSSHSITSKSRNLNKSLTNTPRNPKLNRSINSKTPLKSKETKPRQKSIKLMKPAGKLKNPFLDIDPIRENVFEENRIERNNDVLLNYKGLVDFNYCVAFDPNTLKEKLIINLKKLKISFSNPNKYKFKCTKEAFKFEFSFTTLIETNLIYLNFNKIEGAKRGEYNDLINQIITSIRI